jgi:hypothetical protein
MIIKFDPALPESAEGASYTSMGRSPLKRSKKGIEG